ncbi:hypothetical protein QR680_005554 [Steinernema hermaphroditum]|uniref:M-phase inducer phosphatase n=1 Tax=Steinernema hermaphroditum TaxID=289476 RepID=A0AA39HUT2_9BILA|nr:hypothetical protein QR680_005554 [Steinernema hermaphroditum]
MPFPLIIRRRCRIIQHLISGCRRRRRSYSGGVSTPSIEGLITFGGVPRAPEVPLEGPLWRKLALGTISARSRPSEPLALLLLLAFQGSTQSSRGRPSSVDSEPPQILVHFLQMGDNFFGLSPSSYDFKLSYRRERSMTVPCPEENENSENGMPVALYRSSSEDENTNDSGVSMGFDSKQPISFKQAFDYESDCELTQKDLKTPRKALCDITRLCQNRESEDSPVSRKSSLQQRKRQLLPSSLSFAHSMASLATPSEKRGKFAENSSILRTMSTSVLEIGNSPPAMPTYTYSLETVPKPQKEHEAYRSISGATLSGLMADLGEEAFFEKYIVIDCRFPYEYEGGHVRGAINVHETHELKQLFYHEKENVPLHQRIPIFYCEYSQKRGPTMAKELRRLDRNINAQNYPSLDYQEIYLLDRGYKKLFETDKIHHICDPPAYTSMDDPQHNDSLRKHKSKLNRTKSQRAISRQPTLREQAEMKKLFDASLDSPMHHLSDMRISPRSPAVRQLNFNGVTPKTSRS